MHRGSRRQLIFEDDADRKRFLERLRETATRSGVVVHAYALMSNHYHLVVECPDGGLSAAMKHLNASYAQDFNWRHGYDGHLFRGRFRSLLIDGDVYLVEVVRYVHRNSIAAGLVPDPLADPWSSHRPYVLGSGPSWLSTGRLLAYFGNDRERFRSFVAAPDSARARAVIEAVDHGRPAVGTPAFLRQLQAAAPPDEELAGSVGRIIPIDLQAIDAAVRSHLARATADAVRAGDISLCIARRLGVATSVLRQHHELTSDETVRTRVHRLERRAKTDAELSALLEAIVATVKPARTAA